MSKGLVVLAPMTSADREKLIVKAASLIPPHSFISNATWDDANEAQCGRRCDLAEAMLVGIGLIQPRRKQASP